MAVGSDDTLTVWLNGKEVYKFADRRGFEHEQARFDVRLRKGTNRVLIHCGNRGGPWQFAVAVTAPADFAFLKAPSVAGFNPETYRAAALKGGGDPGRGRRLFADLKGLACIKCHAVGKEGGNVGPELASIGVEVPARRADRLGALLPRPRSPRATSPRRWRWPTAASSPGSSATRPPDAVEIQDADAKLVKVAKDDIDERKRSDVSLMPNGLGAGPEPEGLRRPDRVSRDAQERRNSSEVMSGLGAGSMLTPSSPHRSVA